MPSPLFPVPLVPFLHHPVLLSSHLASSYLSLIVVTPSTLSHLAYATSVGTSGLVVKSALVAQAPDLLSFLLPSSMVLYILALATTMGHDPSTSRVSIARFEAIHLHMSALHAAMSILSMQLVAQNLPYQLEHFLYLFDPRRCDSSKTLLTCWKYLTFARPSSSPSSK
ncbi:hypothetical protein ONZ45_g7551 [Pleurotus djamor]|nr:hypothetical protein ONZ45_g7551 [Pleurotus djamor]